MWDGIEEVYGRKVSEGRKNLPFLGRIAIRYRYQTGVVPVPMIQKQSGTSTHDTEEKWYWYQSKWYRYPLPEKDWYRYRS